MPKHAPHCVYVSPSVNEFMQMTMTMRSENGFLLDRLLLFDAAFFLAGLSVFGIRRNNHSAAQRNATQREMDPWL